MKCSARSSRTGEACKKFAIRGGSVCPSHGGAAHQVKVAAEKRLVLAEARSIVSQHNDGFEELADPAGALLALATEVLAVKSAVAAKAAQLNEIDHLNKAGDVQVQAVMQVYVSLLRDSADVLTKISRLGLEDRRTAVAEADYRKMWEGVQRAVFKRSDLDHDAKLSLVREIAVEALSNYGGSG